MEPSDFEVTTSPPNGIQIGQNSSGQFTVTVTSLAGPNDPPPGPVKLYVRGLPEGATAVPQDFSLVPTAAGASRTVTVAANGALLDTYSIHVTAIGAPFARFAGMDVQVVDPNAGAPNPTPGDHPVANNTSASAYTIRQGVNYSRPTQGTDNRERYWYRIHVSRPHTQLTVKLTGLQGDYDLAVAAPTMPSAPANGQTESEAPDSPWDRIGWEGIDWEGIGWEGIGWEGIGWEGIGWEGIGKNERVTDWADFTGGANVGNTGEAGKLVGVSREPATGDEEAIAMAHAPGWYYILGEPRGNPQSDFTLRVELDEPELIRFADVAAGMSELPVLPPVSDEVTTVVLVHLDRLRARYDLPDTEWANTLNSLEYPGGNPLPSNLRIVRLDVIQPALPAAYATAQAQRIAEIDAACAAWNAAPTDVAAANTVAGTIRSYIWTVLKPAFPNLAYLVLAGNDDIIPAHRVMGRTDRGREEAYAWLNLQPASALGAALAAGCFTTDDGYGAGQPIPFKGHNLWIPDLAVGRLVETPSQIRDQFVGYVAQLNGQPAQKAVVAGWHFVQDAAEVVATILRSRAPHPAIVDATLVGTGWSSTSLENKLDQGPRWDVVALACHADQDEIVAADTSTLGAAAIQGAAGVRQGTVAVNIGCHAGLNVPEQASPGAPLDIVEAFADRQAVYVGNSGYGYGDTGTIGLSELLMQYLFEEMDGTRSVGRAFVRAKQRYLAMVAPRIGFTSYDEKAMVELTLFGMPNYLPVLGEYDDHPEPSDELPEPADSELKRSDTGPMRAKAGQPYTWKHFIMPELDLRPKSPKDPHYYVWANGSGEKQVTIAYPTCPRIGMSVRPRGLAPEIRAHGALLLSATYRDEKGFRPHVGDGRNYWDGSAYIGTPVYTVPRWWPRAPMADVNLFPLAWGQPERLVVYPAQFLPQGDDGAGTERIYEELEYDVCYAPAGSDRARPTINSIKGARSGEMATFEVLVQEGTSTGSSRPAIARVVVTYTTGSGSGHGGMGRWTSIDLVESAVDKDEWVGQVDSVPRPIEYFVQIVDEHGNVAQDDNDGTYYRA